MHPAQVHIKALIRRSLQKKKKHHILRTQLFISVYWKLYWSLWIYIHIYIYKYMYSSSTIYEMIQSFQPLIVMFNIITHRYTASIGGLSLWDIYSARDAVIMHINHSLFVCTDALYIQTHTHTTYYTSQYKK